MKLLLDTHTFIWWTTEPSRLSQPVTEALTNPDNEVFLSVASLWEMQIKKQLGKITFARPLPDLVADEQRANALRLLPVMAEHVYRLDQLPPHHKDPFDRLLLAQAKCEGATLVTSDNALKVYDVALLW